MRICWRTMPAMRGRCASAANGGLRWGGADPTLPCPAPLAHIPAAMQAAFIKMHGCGNDFVVFDERAGPLGLSPARAAAIADRRIGVGCDQFIVIERPPSGSTADVFMRIRNPDGSEAGACGNATRCVADLVARAERRERLVIETVSGLLASRLLADGRVEVDMGPPALGWRDVPLAREMDTLHVTLAAGSGAVSDP